MKNHKAFANILGLFIGTIISCFTTSDIKTTLFLGVGLIFGFLMYHLLLKYIYKNDKN